MSDEITEKAYSSAADDLAKAHRDAVAKARAQIEKAKLDALKKLTS